MEGVYQYTGGISSNTPLSLHSLLSSPKEAFSISMMMEGTTTRKFTPFLHQLLYMLLWRKLLKGNIESLHFFKK